jgi:expansin (peptidoglycan-binding protein)
MRTVVTLGLSLVLALPGCGSSNEAHTGAQVTGNGGSAGAGTGGAAVGASGSSGSGTGGTLQGTATCTAETTRIGQATYYTTADGSGNCSFDPSPNDLMIGAMNATDYAGAAACGACATLDGPSGSVTIRIVDQCPECPQGNIDLSPEAFDKIAVRSQGRVPISWKYVGCNVTTAMSYRFKEGSSQYWTAVQVRHHRYRISKFEYQKNGAFVEVPRQDYNYFMESAGMGPGPYTFRITDVYGDSVIDSGIAFKEAAEVPGTAQFPVCTP